MEMESVSNQFPGHSLCCVVLCHATHCTVTHTHTPLVLLQLSPEETANLNLPAPDIHSGDTSYLLPSPCLCPCSNSRIFLISDTYNFLLRAPSATFLMFWVAFFCQGNVFLIPSQTHCSDLTPTLHVNCSLHTVLGGYCLFWSYPPVYLHVYQSVSRNCYFPPLWYWSLHFISPVSREVIDNNWGQICCDRAHVTRHVTAGHSSCSWSGRCCSSCSCRPLPAAARQHLSLITACRLKTLCWTVSKCGYYCI